MIKLIASQVTIDAAAGETGRREITGIAVTPDGKTMFFNVQHPGENGSIAKPTSAWPDTQTSATSIKRPRSATVVVTRKDGGNLGS